MSALPPVTTKTATRRNGRKVPLASFCVAANNGIKNNGIKRPPRQLFDHLVGGGEQRLRHGEAERLGGLKVYDQLIFACILNWQITWLRTLEDAIDIDGRASIEVYIVDA